MNVAEIKRIIQEQEKERNEILKKERIIQRDLDTKKLKKFIKFPNILIILGIRRCGKSVLSWLLMKDEKYAYINFDDESLYGMKATDLNTVLKAFYQICGHLDFFIFDEIQNVQGWELFANRLRRTKKIIITGSNSQLLASELATHLTGRHIDFVLFPFSFKEFCIYKNISLEEKSEYTTETSAKMEEAVREYIKIGGLPEAYKYGKSILRSIFSDIITKDIIKRYKIRNIAAMESLAKYLVSNFSNEISFNKLKNIFSLKKGQTIKNYVKYFENAYLIFVLERFSFKLKQQIIAPKKIYCIDTGIINTISFKSSENFGKFFENVVCTELFRRKNHLQKDVEIFYWKNAQHEEVDFLVKQKNDVKQLIQVCYNIENDDVKKRELKALVKASKELQCKNLLVITEGVEGEEKIGRNKVRFIPLWKWLLSD